MLFHNLVELSEAIAGTLTVSAQGEVGVVDPEALQSKVIDSLVYNGALNGNAQIKEACYYLVNAVARSQGVYLSSIQGLYEAMGRGDCGGFTVPAINIRGITYDVARAIFRAACVLDVGAFIFEIARSEMGYTFQPPAEYSCSVSAAAVKEGFRGPIFIQGDHFQINAKKYAADPDLQIKAISDLIAEAIASGFYNIDIDTSTLVDLSQSSIDAQQRLNYELVAEFTKYIRGLEPAGITVSTGGEIGEVGGKNSTAEELRAFMDGVNAELKKKGDNLKGISKLSIQTGTTHGGVPLPDGSIADVKLDFETLEKLSKIAREEYGLSGAVQHGASTLPAAAFDRFPKTGTAEVHLATEFQNIIYEHPAFPKDLKDEVYSFLRTRFAAERKEGDSDDQFIYKTRKKGFGQYKEKFWNMPPDIKNLIMSELENKFYFLFEKLNVKNTGATVAKHIEIVTPDLVVPAALNSLS